MVQLSEQQLEQQMQTREVTQVQASWTEQGRAEPGAFTIQLILDNGVAEYIVLPTASDAKVLLKQFKLSGHVMFDQAHKVLIFKYTFCKLESNSLFHVLSSSTKGVPR